MWYAYATEPAKELKAREILTRLGYECALPVETRKKRISRHAKKTVEYAKPLLVGYIFIRIPPTVPWWALFEYRIVRSVVGIDGQPTAICPEAIGRLMAISEQEHDTSPRYAAGDDIKLTSGPLMGFKGRVQKVRGNQATVLFKMLGADRECWIDLDNVVAA